MSDLRNRIASLIYHADGHTDRGWAERTADAVMGCIDMEIRSESDNSQGLNQTDRREWSVEDVADIRLTQYGGVSIYNVCCVTVTPSEARQFAAALIAAADVREADDE